MPRVLGSISLFIVQTKHLPLLRSNVPLSWRGSHRCTSVSMDLFTLGKEQGISCFSKNFWSKGLNPFQPRCIYTSLGSSLACILSCKDGVSTVPKPKKTVTVVTSIEKGIKPYTSFTRDKQAVRSLPFHLNDTVNSTCLAARGDNFCNDIKTLFKHTHTVILSDTRLGSWRSYQAFLVTHSCCIYLLILDACFYMSSQVMPTGALRKAESSKSEFRQFASTISNHLFCCVPRGSWAQLHGCHRPRLSACLCGTVALGSQSHPATHSSSFTSAGPSHPQQCESPLYCRGDIPLTNLQNLPHFACQ